MKGIILAGGKGTRLYPCTLAASKQLLPIYDKPMVYYPLSILMLSNIRDILIISTPEHLPLYKALLGDGSKFGLTLQYQEQMEPKGLAEAFILGEKFIGNDSVCLILGDNVFYGHGLTQILKESSTLTSGGIIFGYPVNDPSRYGVAEIDEHNRVISVEEKPALPKSDHAIPGIYFFDNRCVDFAKSAKPSARGELEITSVINRYVDANDLVLKDLGRGTAWLDTGTHEDLIEASVFVHTIEKRQGLKIACLEEIAYNNGFIDFEQLKRSAKLVEKSEYGQYLQNMIAKLQSSKPQERACLL